MEALSMDLVEMKFDCFEKEEHAYIEDDVQKALSKAAKILE